MKTFKATFRSLHQARSFETKLEKLIAFHGLYCTTSGDNYVVTCKADANADTVIAFRMNAHHANAISVDVPTEQEVKA